MTRSRLRTLVVAGATQVLVLLAVLVGWQLVHRTGIGGPTVNKSPHDVWEALKEILGSGELWPNLKATLVAVFVALGLATAVGTTIGLALALMPRVEKALDPWLSGLNSMPRIALAPLFIIMFGIGTQAKVALAFSVTVFILILNARAGVRGADQDISRLVDAFDASPVQRFFTFLLPVAMPSIFAGIRLALVYSLLGVVTSEMISAKDGLGQLVAEYSAAFQLSKVYAILIVLAVIASLMNAVTGLVERHVFSWQSNGAQAAAA